MSPYDSSLLIDSLITDPYYSISLTDTITDPLTHMIVQLAE
jgi:hypothetical protein